MTMKLLKCIDTNKTIMNKFICRECGTKYSSPEETPPPGIKWSDGHICQPELVLGLEIEKRYMLRNGLVTSPLRKSDNGTRYIFEADVIESSDGTPSVLSWLATGEYLSAATDNRYDIVKAIADEKINDKKD